MVIRILVVDDVLALRTGICALIESQEGLEVCGTAANGLEAIQQAEELHPEVVLMDVEMPGLDGIAATRQIVERSLAQAVVVWSINDTTLRRTQSHEAGAAAFVTKGASIEELMQTLLKVA